MEETISKTNPAQDKHYLNNLDLSDLFFAIKINFKKASVFVISITSLSVIFALSKEKAWQNNFQA